MAERVILLVLFTLFVFALGRMIVLPKQKYTGNSYSTHNYLPVQDASETVEVTGAVASNGMKVPVTDNMRVADVIQAAGGITSIADISQVDLAMFVNKQNLPTGSIYVPFKNDTPNAAIPFYRPPNELIAASGSQMLNLNAATVDEIVLTTGIPTKIARNIVEYRDKHGKIKTISELSKVDGVGAEVMFRLRKKTSI